MVLTGQMKRVWGLAAVAAVLFAPQSGAAAAAGRPGHVATITVDTGFRVKRDGFSFRNYGGLSASTAMSKAHMFQMLKDVGRCEDDGTNPKCTLRNGFVIDLAHLNEHLSQGRCEGMVVLAARIFLHKTRLVHISYRATDTYHLTLEESADEIAYWWATQLAPNLQLYAAEHRAVQTHDLAHEILARMRNKVMLTIGLYTPEWSHAVLAIKATYRANVTKFTVYDPNFPGQTRLLVLDHIANSWVYRDALASDGTLETVSGAGAGGLDYLPVNLRSTRTQWELLGGF